MNPSAILTITASAMEWVLANFPAIGILVFIAWCIWKYISWLDSKFSAINTNFSTVDNRFAELRSEMTLELVKVRTEMASGFAELSSEIADVRSDIKLINHRLDDHDKKIIK